MKHKHTNRKVRSGIVSLILILVLIINPSFGAAQSNVTTANLVEIESTFVANQYNDIFIQSEPYLSSLNHDFYFNTSGNSVTGTHYIDSSRTNIGSFGPTEFNGASTGYVEYRNTTNENLELTFKTDYYSFGNEEVQDLSNVAFNAFEDYGFRLNFQDTQPIFLSMTSNVPVQITVTLIQPDTTIVSTTIDLVRNVENRLPVLPLEDGEYVLVLSSNADTILSSLKIIDNPDIIESDTGITEELTGTSTISKFLKINNNNTVKLVDFQQTLFQSAVGGISDLLGTFEVYYFDNQQSLVNEGALGSPITTDQPIYVGIVGSPPDESDPGVAGTKEDLNLPEGMYMQYSIIAEKTNIPTLPINEDFELETSVPYSGTERYYSFSTSNDIAIGLNSTANNVDVSFVSSDPEIGNILLRERSPQPGNDVLEEQELPEILPAGTYLVVFDGFETYHISTFDIPNMVLNGELQLTQTYQENRFIHMPSSEFNYDFLNITYLDKLNRTADYEITIFEADGNVISSISPNFEHYYNGGLNFNNLTSIQTNVYNFEDNIYVKVYVSGNSQYNNSQPGDLLYSNQNNISSTIHLNRLNYQILQSETSSVVEYYFDDVSTSSTVNHELRDTNTSILGYYELTTTENTAYRLKIDATNRSLTEADLFVGNNFRWLNSAQTTGQIIDNITHYIIEFNFVSTTDKFGLYIDYDANAVNGTVSISLEELTIHELPDLSFPLFVAGEVDEEAEEDGGGINPLYIAGGIAAVAVIAGAAYFISGRRGPTKTSFD